MREKSDQDTKLNKLSIQSNTAEDRSKEGLSNLKSICQILVSLIEVNCMQIRTEEQEDEDKKGIALMGLKLGTSNKNDYIEGF